MLKDWSKSKLVRSEFVFGSKFNVVVLNTHNSLAHELKKCEYAYNLAKAGEDFACEQQLTRGRGTPDLVLLGKTLDESPAYEFMVSEDEKSIEQKVNNYPFPVVPVRVR